SRRAWPPARAPRRCTTRREPSWDACERAPARQRPFVLTAIIVLLLAGPRDAHNQGNRLYAAKDYAGAAAAYREALAAGHDSRAHYNLGNALFKSGKIGEAILNYRRAYALAPRDRDVRDNLAFARAYRLDRLSPSQNPLARGLDRTFHALSRSESSLWGAL